MCDYKQANCYGYALGMDFNASPGSSYKQIEYIDWTKADGVVITETLKKKLVDACKRDGLEETTQEDQKQIAVFINGYTDQLDYHFYRRDGGSWSNKMSNTGALVGGIADPITANLQLVGTVDSNGDAIIQQEFCCFMYKKVVKTREDFEPVSDDESLEQSEDESEGGK